MKTGKIIDTLISITLIWIFSKIKEFRGLGKLGRVFIFSMHPFQLIKNINVSHWLEVAL